jgi:hypothetical protein
VTLIDEELVEPGFFGAHFCGIGHRKGCLYLFMIVGGGWRGLERVAEGFSGRVTVVSFTGE